MQNIRVNAAVVFVGRGDLDAPFYRSYMRRAGVVAPYNHTADIGGSTHIFSQKTAQRRG